MVPDRRSTIFKQKKNMFENGQCSLVIIAMTKTAAYFVCNGKRNLKVKENRTEDKLHVKGQQVLKKFAGQKHASD